jgi:hypothetical protein
MNDYLDVIRIFIGYPDEPFAVLTHKNIRVFDKIGFALKYLSDEKLNDYFTELIRECT